MSQETRQRSVREKTQQLLQGSLKHVRVAALAAALVPLAAVAVTHSVAQAEGQSGGTTASVPSPCDFVTSGGFVVVDGKEANFGAHGGCKSDGFWGHLNYVDHSTGYHVDSVQITGYLTSSNGSGTTRDICGLATTNNPADPQPVPFRVRLDDNGEPGTADQFGIRVSTTYVVTTRLLNAGSHGGGNVQLHDPNPSTVGPIQPPDELTMCNGVAEP